MTWIQLYNKKAFYPWSPKQGDFDLETIARSLSRIPRFLGHTSDFYSVAQHCCDCLLGYYSNKGSLYLDDKQINAVEKAILFHDAHEAYCFGDIPSPVKNELRSTNENYYIPDYNLIEHVTDGIDEKLAEWLGINVDEFYQPAVKLVDMVALATEKRDLMAGGPSWDIELPEPRKDRIIPVSMNCAYDEFKRLANELGVY